MRLRATMGRMFIANSSPSQQHVDPDAIGAFIDALEASPGIEPHGLIIHRNGHRIAEGYWAPHGGARSRLVYSLSKSFTGTALALQLAEGRLGLDDLVSDHLPTYFTNADERTKKMRIRHIASMATGHDRETMIEAFVANPQDPLQGFFQIPPDAEPGRLFAYNQPPVLALATILQQLAGQRLVDYLRPRVLDPIGVGDFRWSQFTPGIDLGFSGVHTNLDAIARLGQLYLDDGVNDGARLLPDGWVKAASSVQIPNPQREQPDWARGYGFQLWMCLHGYRGDGAFGQYMVVLPEQQAVVAMFSCTENMQPVLDLMWEHLVPAMGSAAESKLSEARVPTAADAALAQRLEQLAQPTAAQRLNGGPPHFAEFVGQAGLADPDGPALTLKPAPFLSRSQRTVQGIQLSLNGDRILIDEGEGSESLDLPLTADWFTVADAPFAASATTLPNGRVAVDVVLLETPHRLEIELDPSSQTFTTKWPAVPLFLSAGDRVAAMRAPL